jgi:excisionase family DNA binding protein
MTRADLLAAIRDAPLDTLYEWIGLCAEAQALAQARIAQTHTPVSAGAPGTPRVNRNLSALEASQRSGVSTAYLYKQVKAGTLPFALRIGGRVLFDESGLERWIRQRRVR